MENDDDKTPSSCSSSNEESGNDDGSGSPSKLDSPQEESSSAVKKRLKNITFGRAKKKTNFKSREGSSKKKKNSSWSLVRLCARTDSCLSVTSEVGAVSSGPCVCTAYRRTEGLDTPSRELNLQQELRELAKADRDTCDQCSTKELLPRSDPTSSEVRSRLPDLGSGVGEPRRVSTMSGLSELALTFASRMTLNSGPIPQYPYLARWGSGAEAVAHFNAARFCSEPPVVHTQIDYTHHLVPDLLEITNFGYYWGKMDRYEAEKLLENKPEGTFLLRDSAQDDHLFSVSFRRFDRSLHARIEQWNDRFSFDSHDPGVYSCTTVSGLIEHYKDPAHCMFFEPMLTIPLHRNFPFSLQHLARATLCPLLTYDSINQLNLPKRIRSFLKEYHYKKQVRVRRFDPDH